MLPHRAELEGKSLYVGTSEGKVVVGKLVSASCEDSKSHKHTHTERAQQWGNSGRTGCGPSVYFWPGMERAIRDRLKPHGNFCKAALTLEGATVKGVSINKWGVIRNLEHTEEMAALLLPGRCSALRESTGRGLLAPKGAHGELHFCALCEPSTIFRFTFLF